LLYQLERENPGKYATGDMRAEMAWVAIADRADRKVDTSERELFGVCFGCPSHGERGLRKFLIFEYWCFYVLRYSFYVLSSTLFVLRYSLFVIRLGNLISLANFWNFLNQLHLPQEVKCCLPLHVCLDLDTVFGD
jgi:hypothetical protein